MLSVPATAGSGASVLPMFRIGFEVTVVVSSEPLTGPASVLVMLYVLLWITVPLASGELTCTTRVTVPEAPAASPPRLQVTTPPARSPGAEADTKVVLAGTVSLMTTLVAFSYSNTGNENATSVVISDTVKVVLAGTVSLMTTLVAFSLPVLEYDNV